jgi:Domain of unknown function (DUF1905)/Bacteriocin-protection, YdeI or OmpD-Associated
MRLEDGVGGHACDDNGRSTLGDVKAFEAPIIGAPRGGAYVEVPPAVVAALGGKGRIPVRATFDGIAYRGSIVSMGGKQILGILKAIRSELGKSPGDPVKVTVEVDEAERSVSVPDDLAAALADAGLRDAFTANSYSHQREHVTWIEAAKQPATRARRISQTIDRLRG